MLRKNNTMKYQVVTHEQLDRFEQLVAKQLQAGWVLVGGIAVSREHGSESYYQAMIKPVDH